MEHTPGPWKMYSGKLRPKFPTPIIEVQTVDGTPVVPWPGFDDSDRSKREHLANARLIAAAPEMYAFVSAVLDGCNDGGYCSCWRCNQARALLNKIDGTD
jgi:hypothetical protein